MASCGQGEQEMAKALGSATFIRSPGPGAQRETQGRQLGRLQVGSSPWPVPQMRLHVFWTRWGHWQVFFSLRSLLI